MTDVTVGGETFNVLVEGEETKPVLTISNPLGVDLHLWDQLIPALLEHFRVVRYDSRGHGGSVADEGPYSIAGLAQDALGILDALGVEKTHWLGLSKGGLVGQWLLVHARERIDRAVLANTAAQIPGPDLWNERIAAARELGLDAVAENVADRWFTKRFREANPEAVERVLALLRQTPVQGYTAAAAAIRDADQREIIRSITNPVLVIVGRHDQSVPPGLGALVANSIEGAQLATLEASHISNVEDPENFTKAVVDFLTAADGRAQQPAPARRRAPAKKTAAKKAPAQKTPTKKALAKKAVAQKAPVKKAPVKKAAMKKAPAIKAPVKKSAAKKASTKKASATKVAAKKVAAKKTAVKKAPVKKAAVKKATSKKIPAKKLAAKKPVAKTPIRSRFVAKKAAPKKGASRKRT